MDSSDESIVERHEGRIPTLPSIQDRRKQLEAFQAERALNRSLRASVRRHDRGTRAPTSLASSVFRPTRSISVAKPTAEERTTKNDPTQEQDVDGHQEDGTSVQEFNTQRIIQHFEGVSKKNTPPTLNPLGVRRYGTSAHKVEKRQPPTLSRTLRSSNLDNGTMGTNSQPFNGNKSIGRTFTRVISESIISLNDEQKPSAGTGGDGGVRNDLMIPWDTAIEPLSASKPEFVGTKSVRQDRSSALAPGKKQEELYLSQARLLQLYLMDKNATEQFESQKKLAEAHFQTMDESILKQEARLRDAQESLKVENEMLELESSLGKERDQLIAIVNGLKALQKHSDELVVALDHKNHLTNISGIDERTLQLWLDHLKDCRIALDAWTKKYPAKENEGMLPGIAQVMIRSCDVAKQETHEWLQCLVLLRKVQDAELTESRLGQSHNAQSDRYTIAAARD